MQSVHITTNVVISNPVHGEVSWKQHYVINLSDTCADRWFSPGTPVFTTNKNDRHDMAEILLKVTLNTINQPTNQLLHCSLQLYLTFTFELTWKSLRKVISNQEALK